MKNKKLLSRAILILFTILSIMMFSTAVCAASDTAVTQKAVVNYDDNAEIVTMSSDSDSDKPDMTKVILIAAGISIVVTGITVVCIYISYKTNGKTEPYQFGSKAPLDLKESSDILVDTRITKVKIKDDK